MAIPHHLLHAVEKHRKEGRKAGLVVRHAERHAVLDLRTHEDVLLTDRGHQQAIEGGRLLAKLSSHVRVVHSTVERCAQTARGLVAGARGAGAVAEIVGPSRELAAPFVKDPERAWKLVHRTGPGFMRAWFDGKLPPDILDPRPVAARGQLEAFERHVREHTSDVLTVFVSHDWNIAIVREEILGITPESRWPGYLDGVALALDGDALMVELDGKVGRSR